MTGEYRSQQIAWNQTAIPYPRERTIPDLFEEQVQLRPDEVAVLSNDLCWTYRELNERAESIARRLRRVGVGPDKPVGIYRERSPEVLAAMLGILKAGGGILPLDPTYPTARLDFLLTDAQPAALLTVSSLRDRLRAAESAASLPILLLDEEGNDAASSESGTAPTPEGLAIILYTSGSTGTPKGVAIPHRAVVRLVRGTHLLKFGADTVYLQLAPLSFDTSLLEIWGALLNGGRIVVPPPGAPSLPELKAAIGRYGITNLMLTTGLFHLVAESDPEMLRSVRQLEVGGEILSPIHARRALEFMRGDLINGYGPTECTTVATSHIVTPADTEGGSIPIGRPIGNTTAYVLDAEMQPVAPGVEGDLWLGGDGLARGYWNRPALTAEKFVPDPFSEAPGACLYRTGDRAQWRSDGVLEFFGRQDDQIKISGYRIEPGEVEAAILAHPGIAQAVVVATAGADKASAMLAAYIVPRVAGENVSDLRSFVAQRLPEHLVPAHFIVLDNLPLTPNGKVDRKALANARMQRPALSVAFSQPEPGRESQIAEVWEEVLQIRPIGAEDSFFDLGGKSLQMIRVQRLLGERLPAAPTITLLFQYPTIRSLAKMLGGSTADQGTPSVESSANANALQDRARQQREAMQRFRSRGR